MRPGSENSATQGRIPGRNYFVARVVGDASKQGLRHELGYCEGTGSWGDGFGQGFSASHRTESQRSKVCASSSQKEDLVPRCRLWLSAEALIQSVRVSPEGSQQVWRGGRVSAGCRLL